MLYWICGWEPQMLKTSALTPRGVLDDRIGKPPDYCPAVNRWRAAPPKAALRWLIAPFLETGSLSHNTQEVFAL